LKDPKTAELDTNPVLGGYGAAFCLACLPGLHFLLGKRYLAGFLLFLSLIAAGMFRQPEVIVGVILCSILSSIYWTSRIRTHNKNVKSLTNYEPEWKE
jgi:hypothetical protein